MSAEQELKRLNYKRGAIKGKLTAFENFLQKSVAEPQLSELQLAELQLRFDKIIPIFDEFDALQTDIEMLSTAASGEGSLDERQLFENAYYASMSSAQVLIQRHAVRRNSAANESESLGQPTDNWDTLIVHMMANKLDSVTSREWELRRNAESTVPSLEVFKVFLLQRADFLESLEDKQSKLKHEVPASVHNHHSQSKSKGVFATTSFDANNRRQSYSNQCPLCKKTHNLYSCPLFRKLSVESRLSKARAFKVCLNCLCHGHNESQCRLSNCKYCNKRHNTLIHIEPTREIGPKPDAQQNIAVVADQTVNNKTSSHVLLSTALVKVTDSNGRLQTARILLDNGSTTNFITQDLCTRLNKQTRHLGSKVTGINNHTCSSSQACSIQIHSINEKFKTEIDCYVLSSITTAIPTTYIDIQSIQLPSGIELADPRFNTPADIDILVGAELFWNILGPTRISLGKHQPTLCESKLGWLVSGGIAQPKPNDSICMFSHGTASEPNVDISRFWELDTVAPRYKMTSDENACEEHFLATTTRDADGRFIVSMPLKESPEVLGDSYQRALATFLSVERRLEKNPILKNLYSDFLAEYENLGHMSKSATKEDTVSCFLPHHGVLRESSTTTKLRVVFNGSSPTTSGKSFNDIQRVGPAIQDDLQSILLRFRQHNFVVTADVEKMYRQVQIDESQRSLQKILWRSHPSQPISIYKLNTVTYGTACAPYLATRCLTQLGYDSDDENVKHAICHDFYVDDFLSGRETIAETISLCKNVTHSLESAKFNLRKWHSNNKEILRSVCQDAASAEIVNLSIDESSKTLGLNWQCFQDTLTFSINVNTQNKISKRAILSTIAQVFDPLGLVSPCIVEAKIIMQQLWINRCSWDDEVPQSIKEAWVRFAQTLPNLNQLSIPRCIKLQNASEISLHVFTDASEKAYGACIYVRSVGRDGSVSVRLLASKSKIAPIKPQTTIPRLELSGALLGAKLYSKVTSSLTLEFKDCVFWSDSTIALGWIASSPLNLKTFVRHRVSEIQELTAGCHWRYVPSKDNPADLVSRGLSADALGHTSLWWSGPQFIQLDPSHWPRNPNTVSILPEMVEKSFVIQERPENMFSRLIQSSSSFTKLKRVMAFVFRFIGNCRKTQDRQQGHLSIQELERSSNFLLRRSQEDSFPKELDLLTLNKPLPGKCNLSSLSPFLGEDNLIRVGGRLSNSSYEYNVKHPVLLSSKHNLSRLIFQMYHILFMHSGPQLLLATTRHKYWTIRGRDLAKSTVHRCVKCSRFSGKTIQPVMGNLPKERVELEYPFLETGVDYAGPIMITNRKGRGSNLIKSYICAFVCLATKAVHLELVTDLTKEAYIAALTRFIGRRGKPHTIFSDNGTTFRGTCNEFSKFIKESLSTGVTEGIRFSFIPAYTPHFGGLWESAIKSIKHHLRRVLDQSHLTYEEMSTLLIQIEAILNSRPLTPLSEDPNDLHPLTPAHFLIGRSINFVPHPQITTSRITNIQRWKRVELLKQQFWNRFSNEYVLWLQQKSKWHTSAGELHEGMMVVVKDKTLPPLLWQLGRVVRVIPGADGVARVADIKTQRGVIRRAYNNICTLPVDTN